MDRRIFLTLTLPLLAAGCAGLVPATPPGEVANLPRDFVVGAGDPTRAALSTAASGFTVGNQLRGDAVNGAWTIVSLEYITVNTALPILDMAPPFLSRVVY